VASKLNNVLYLAVIRVDGQCIVASYGQPKYESTVNQVVNAPAFRSKVGTGQRIRKYLIPLFFKSTPINSPNVH